MKHNKLLSLLLAAVLLPGLLSGCGKTPGAQAGPQTSAQSSPASQNAAQSAQSSDPVAPRYAYVPEFFALPQEIESVFSASCADDLAFFGGRINEGTLTFTRTITDENGNTIEQEVVRPSFRETVFSYDLKTKTASELKNLRLPQAPEGWENVEIRINGIYALADRTAWLELFAQPIRYNLPESFDPERDQKEAYAEYGMEQAYLLHVSEDGTQLGRIELGECSYFSSIADDSGRAYVFLNNCLTVYDPQGQVLFSMEEPDHGTLRRISGDRVVMVCYVTDPVDQTNRMELRPVDAENKGYGETILLERPYYEILPGSGEYTFFYQQSNDIYGYLQGSDERPRILSWIDCDIEPNRVSNVCVQPDGSFFLLYADYGKDSTSYQLVVMRLTDVTDQPEKTVLQMAGFRVSSGISEQIVAFNRRNETCRISLTDYANVSATPEAGLLLLNTQIMAGNVPDLFLTAGLPIPQLAARGLIADLYPLIDSGRNGLSRDSFVQPVLKALETDGKLYQIPDSFLVNTAFGLERVVGGYAVWDFAALQDAFSKLPAENARIFNKEATKTNVLESCLRTNLSSFIDWTTGTCSFDSDAFLSLLELADSFPAEYDAAKDDEPYEAENHKIARGAQLLNRTNLTSFSSYIYRCLWFDEPICFVGIPNGGINNGSCFSLENATTMAISSSCRDTDGAWSFISQFLTDAYQLDEENHYENSFPINQAAFDTFAKKMTEYRYSLGNDGKPFVDEFGNTRRIPWESVPTGKTYPADFEVTDSGGELIARVNPDNAAMIDVYRLSDEQIASVCRLIEETTVVSAEETSLHDIIMEECNAFFAGEKDAKKTAEIIQSRAGIYVAEQS